MNKLKVVSILLSAYFVIALAQLLWVESNQKRLNLNSFLSQLKPSPVTEKIEVKFDPESELRIATKIGTFEKANTNDQFLWITSRGEVIEITNDNNNPIQKKLTFSLNDNPCRKDTQVLISNKNFKEIFKILRLSQKIEIPLRLEPNEKQVIIFSPQILSNEEIFCKVDNGDERDFISRITKIDFEIYED